MIETARSVAHPWLCDVMGHLSTPHYLAVFDIATYHLFAAANASPAKTVKTGLGWADVRHEIDYKSEVKAGSLLRVQSEVIRIGGKSVTHRHELLDVDDCVLKATLLATTVAFDLEARAAITIPDLQRAGFAALIEAAA
ncbi:MAG: thioesterase superfamily protein [Rhodospirillales bacterium]|nr:thioesterase superfamily protein [Rhodospirillales bacterium]